jgi:ABC-type multidrug transport system fused ATPase/permease subunit
MRSDIFPVDNFTDDAAKQAYAAARSAREKATAEADIARLMKDADANRDEALARGKLLSAACVYLDLAQSGKTIGKANPEKLYHFAANAFRDLGLLQRAAECYFNAALTGYRAYQSTGRGDPVFVRRSAGRAKSMFSALGDDENSDDAHILQQRIYLAELRAKKRHTLATIYALWDWISHFGTSPMRWITSVLLTVIVFAGIYAALLKAGHALASPQIERACWAALTSSLYFSIGNLFQFGTLGTLTPRSELAQLTMALHGIAAFILVGTGATFLTRR